MKFLLSAADSKYFKSAVNLILSLNSSQNKDFGFVLYDLGIAQYQNDILRNTRKKLSFQVEIKQFNFDDYPEFVRPQMGSYAWKPIIIDQELNTKKSALLYLDSASLVHGNLSTIWNIIEETGLYTPICGSGSLTEWTHPETFGYFEPIDAKNIRNRCGGLCGFDYQNSLARELVSDWKKYALINDCIQPVGSNRTNHRHDQSIFNILLHQNKYKDLSLSQSEVNISSSKPITEITVRNKLPDNFPINLLWLSRIYFQLKFRLDKLINKFN